MVARRGERIRQALEHSPIGVEDGAGLAVQQFRCAVDGAAERDADGLMAQADAEQRRRRGRARVDQRDGRTGPFRGAGAGAEQHPVEFVGDGGDVGVGGQAVVVVAPDLRVHPELTQILHEVEHEAVVVVDDQNLHVTRLPPGVQ